MPKEKRLLDAFSPLEKGCQLLSRKVRPNDKCLCGSGKKQKHCHGTATRYLSSAPKVQAAVKEKHLLIIGPPESGKSQMAKDIASKYSPDEVCFFSMRRKRTVPVFFFDGCQETTRLVIIDEIKSISLVEQFFKATGGIEVNQKGKPLFTINPRIICISESIKESDIPTYASFTERFDVVNLTR